MARTTILLDLVFLAIALVSLLIAGCASPIILVNPTTGQTAQCGANTAWAGVGGGIAMGIGANIAVQRCVEQMESLGYVKADNYGDAKKAMAERNEQQVNNLKQQAKTQLDQIRSITPDRPYCRLGVTMWPDGTVVGVEPARAGGLLPGDHIVAVNGVRTADGVALITAVAARQPDEELSVMVIRNGGEIQQSVKCVDGRQARSKMIALLSSASDGNWSECKKSSYQFENLTSIRNYALLSLRYLCSDAERLLAGRPSTNTDAQLAYDARRQQIAEAQYVVGGLDKIRGEVLATISWFEQNNFNTFAADLRSQLEETRARATARE